MKRLLRLSTLIITPVLLLIISDCKKEKDDIPISKPCRNATTFEWAQAQIGCRSPANESIAQPVSLTLSWCCYGRNETYDVYFGKPSDASLTKISENQTENNLTISGLDLNTEYYWSVTAQENVYCGLTSETGILWFITVSQ
jgi:hypothetical protein